MKKVILLLLFPLLCSLAIAQPSWTWLQGDPYTPRYGVYGTKGIADPANKPGNRTGEISWKDNSGNIWVLGGNGYATSGSGYLSDLWKYSPSTGLWTWISGDAAENQFGVYGTRGVASITNKIRARAYATSWTDASGDLWLFGGKGSDDAVQSYVPIIFNDFWKFSPTTGMWTWMGGDTAYKSVLDYASVYGIKGVATATNKPGSRHSAGGWADASGNFWIFGGEGRGNPFRGALNDLWKYAPSSGLWTWVGGDNTENQSGIYGTRGIAAATNKPGAKIGASTWRDASGNLLLFGGRVITGTYNNLRFSNDLWMYTPSTGLWTWISGDSGENQAGVYGTKGIPSVSNRPGARYGAASGTDASGNLLLYGGTIDNSGFFNDLWKYSPSSNQWTWLSGDIDVTSYPAVYGQQGIPSDTTRPAAGLISTLWTDNDNNLWISSTNHIFRYSLTSSQWTWVRGDTILNKYYPPVYGTKGVLSVTNTPGPRQFSSSWTDASGNCWLFGGYNLYGNGFTSVPIPFNDLWKYNAASNQWAWMNGDSSLSPSYSYGTKGIAAPTNKPPGRQRAISWSDNNKDFWLFGGVSSLGVSATFSDLWKYSPSTGLWTWMSGDSTSYTSGEYGIRGVAASTNKPGIRSSAASWTDNTGNLWLFGGNGPWGYYNDLWKYSLSTGWWTWIGGDNTISKPDYASTYIPRYGQKGVATGTNTPGGRYGSLTWKDTSGDLWLFGGTAAYFHVTKSLNDLWKYSPATGFWTWISGDNTYGQPGVYGTQGVAAPSNKPGARNGAISWKDAAGNLLFFGGNVDTSQQGTNYTTAIRYFNDVWKYAVSSDSWTWLSGDTTVNQSGVFGIRGIASNVNKPGARTGTAGWSDGSGNLWIYGGYGYPATGIRNLNDLLKFAPLSSLPIQFSGFTAQQQNKSVLLEWSTAREQNSRLFAIERSTNGMAYAIIGTVAASGTVSFTTQYSFTDPSPINGGNFYRLKEFDLDGAFTYSQVKKVIVSEDAARFNIIDNPVLHDVQVSIQLTSAQKLLLQLRDVNGQLLLRKEYMAGKGNNLFWLPVERLAKGVYLISVHSKDLHHTKTFFKQ